MSLLRITRISAPLGISTLILVFCAAFLGAAAANAQDIPIGVTYVCSGEHIYICLLYTSRCV